MSWWEFTGNVYADAMCTGVLMFMVLDLPLLGLRIALRLMVKAFLEAPK